MLLSLPPLATGCLGDGVRLHEDSPERARWFNNAVGAMWVPMLEVKSSPPRVSHGPVSQGRLE